MPPEYLFKELVLLEEEPNLVGSLSNLMENHLFLDILKYYTFRHL